MASARNWRTLRAFAAQTAEAAAPSDTDDFVSLGESSRKIEIRVAAGASTGSTNPTGLTLRFWRGTLDANGDAVIDRIADVPYTVTSNDVDEGLPFVLSDVGSELFYVTVPSFVSGSAPALTATVQIRSLEPSP